MRFFFDHNLPQRLAHAIHLLTEPQGHQVVHLLDRFDGDTPDIEWIGRLSRERDWVIVSGDVAITRKPHEREAWAASGLTAFFMSKGFTNLHLFDQGSRLIRVWPHIANQAALARPGSGFVVPMRFTGKRGGFKPII